MAKLAKCKNCEKELLIEQRYKYNNKNYCLSCYNIRVKEKEDYDNLIQWTCNYFEFKNPNGLILKQIKEYKANYNYTYGGIHYCLWYLTEVKCLKLDVKYGIALVKFEYENAKNYFIQQENIKNSIKEPTVNKVVKTIKLKTNRDLKSKFLINIDELIMEE